METGQLVAIARDLLGPGVEVDDGDRLIGGRLSADSLMLVSFFARVERDLCVAIPGERLGDVLALTFTEMAAALSTPRTP